jgi:hypothetical protein
MFRVYQATYVTAHVWSEFIKLYKKMTWYGQSWPGYMCKWPALTSPDQSWSSLYRMSCNDQLTSSWPWFLMNSAISWCWRSCSVAVSIEKLSSLYMVVSGWHWDEATEPRYNSSFTGRVTSEQNHKSISPTLRQKGSTHLSGILRDWN